MSYIEWYEICFQALKVNFKARGYEVKIRSASTSDLGAFKGIEFNCAAQGGYIDFWDSGYVGYQLVDYLSGEQLIADTVTLIHSGEMAGICELFEQSL